VSQAILALELLKFKFKSKCVSHREAVQRIIFQLTTTESPNPLSRAPDARRMQASFHRNVVPDLVFHNLRCPRGFPTVGSEEDEWSSVVDCPRFLDLTPKGDGIPFGAARLVALKIAIARANENEALGLQSKERGREFTFRRGKRFQKPVEFLTRDIAADVEQVGLRLTRPPNIGEVDQLVGLLVGFPSGGFPVCLTGVLLSAEGVELHVKFKRGVRELHKGVGVIVDEEP